MSITERIARAGTRIPTGHTSVSISQFPNVTKWKHRITKARSCTLSSTANKGATPRKTSETSAPKYRSRSQQAVKMVKTEQERRLTARRHRASGARAPAEAALQTPPKCRSRSQQAVKMVKTEQERRLAARRHGVAICNRQESKRFWSIAERRGIERR